MWGNVIHNLEVRWIRLERPFCFNTISRLLIQAGNIGSASDSNMETKRERIIPHKRGLLPVSVSSSTSASASASSSQSSPLSTGTKIQKRINPSAVPAVLQLQRPVFSSLKGVTTDKEHSKDGKSEETRYTTGLDEEAGSNKVIRIEFDSSQAPQPFLEPELLQKMVEGRRHKKSSENDEDTTEGSRDILAELNTEREVRRRAAQTDYGSMAIRDRMAVSGRGRRRR